MSSEQTRTIHEVLAAAPSEDVRDTWEAFWATLTQMRDRLLDRFDLSRHPSTDGYDYYSNGDDSFEGSLTAYTGGAVDWMVHSWIGNRRQSILDMNINVWLGPQIDVPHLCIVFGTVPKIFHYSDFIARRDLGCDIDYLNRWYGPENEHYLQVRGDDRLTYSVSHGLHTRAVASPVVHSYMAERTPENVELVREAALGRFNRWMQMVDSAEPVPEAEQSDLHLRDRKLRELTYKQDPMNSLAEKVLGPELTAKLVDLRWGRAQVESGE